MGEEEVCPWTQDWRSLVESTLAQKQKAEVEEGDLLLQEVTMKSSP